MSIIFTNQTVILQKIEPLRLSTNYPSFFPSPEIPPEPAFCYHFRQDRNAQQNTSTAFEAICL